MAIIKLMVRDKVMFIFRAMVMLRVRGRLGKGVGIVQGV